MNERERCPDWECHGSVCWCDSCGHVAHTCSFDSCHTHAVCIYPNCGVKRCYTHEDYDPLNEVKLILDL